MTRFSTREQKLAAVQRVSDLVGDTVTIEQACFKIGCSKQQYYRWAKGQGLGKRGVPTDESKRTGRPPKVELTEAEQRRLRLCSLKKRGSVPLAVELFLREAAEKARLGDEYARPEVLQALNEDLEKIAATRKRISWPMAVRRACHYTQEEWGLYCGAKATANVVPIGFRKLTWIDLDGVEHPLLPGDLYESDDMSLNQPYRYGGAGEEELGRQALYTNDVFSLKMLGGGPCGRPKDAYRVEDIASHMLNIVEDWGLPMWWRLERGPWENTFINGVALDHLGPSFEDQRWGALDDLFGIVRAYGSRGKGAIEGSFNFFQALMEGEYETTEIGRKRGEFEAAMKTFLAARSLKTPEKRQRQLDKFWSIEECADGSADQMGSFNARPKQRREWDEMIAPDELFLEHPGKRELQPEDRWYFYPCKDLRVVRSGQIHVTDKHWGAFCFTVNGVYGAPVSYLPDGLKVLIAFDPARPELGCRVANADMGPRNRGQWNFGELLVSNAPSWGEEAPPQIDLRPTAEKRDRGQSKRNATTAVRSEYRATRDINKPGEDPGKQSVARDGLGTSLVVANRPETGPSVAASASTSPGSRTRSAKSGPSSGVVGNRRNQPETNDPTEDALAKLKALESEATSQLF